MEQMISAHHLRKHITSDKQILTGGEILADVP